MKTFKNLNNVEMKEKTQNPNPSKSENYSSMWLAIQKIGDAPAFEELKRFYGTKM